MDSTNDCFKRLDALLQTPSNHDRICGTPSETIDDCHGTPPTQGADTPEKAINRAYRILRKNNIKMLDLRAITEQIPPNQYQERIKARKAFIAAAAPGREEELEAVYQLIVWIHKLRMRNEVLAFEAAMEKRARLKAVREG